MKILEISDLDKARVTDTIRFNCEECGKEVFLERRYFTKPLCKKCKVKDTVKEKYGVENVFNLSSSREHLKESLKSEKTKNKRKQTCLEKYGTEFQISSKETREKIKLSCLEKYGTECSFQAKSVIEKIKNTKIERYGEENPSIKWLYEYKSEKFDSSWELAYWIWCEDNNINIKRNKKGFEVENGNRYFPDFEVNGKLVEIKSSYLISNPLYKFKEKINIENNITIISDNEIILYLKYIENKYGKNYLKSFKTKKSKIN